jgi:hypothetical protein
MRRALLSLAGLVAAAACVPASSTSTSSPGRNSALWPPQVVQALPPGIPDEAVLRDSDGCYSYRDPAAPTGFSFVIGIDGRQLCDGRFPDEAEIRARAAAMRADLEAGKTDVVDVPPAQ